MKKILVAIDESVVSESVLQTAREFAEEFNAEVLTMTVITRVIRPYHAKSGIDAGKEHTKYDNPKEIADKLLANAEEFFKDYPGKHETLYEFGEPADKILDVLERENPDLLIMGSRGLSGFKRVMLGSVSTKVLHHATCNVIIVKHSQ